MVRNFRVHGVALVVLLVGCVAGCQDANGPGDEGADGCVDDTELLPTDTAIVGLASTADGTLWAMGNQYRWWANGGGGWEPVDSLRGTGGGGITAEGSTLWAVGQWGVFHGDGTSWTDESAGLPEECTVLDAAGLGDGRVAMVSNEEVIDGNDVHVRLHVWDGGAFSTTDLGWVDEYGRVVAGDGAGAALAAGESVAWLLDGDAWSEVVLPVEAYWVDAAGFGGRWALVSSDGTVLRGSPDAWIVEEVEVVEPRIAGSAEDDLWIVGLNQGYDTGVIWRDQGLGWEEVTAPEQALWAAVTPTAGEIVVGADGPAIGRGGDGGVAIEWTTPTLVGDGAAWSAPDGRVFLADYHGQLLVDDGGTWTSLGYVGESGDRVFLDGCGGVVFALSEEGVLSTWDGTTLERDQQLIEENTQYNDLGVGQECVPVAGGRNKGGGEVDTPLVRYLADGAWLDLPTPPDRYVIGVLASSPSDLLVATNDGLYLGDGATWLPVSGTTDDVSDLARTGDGRVWVSTQNAGLNELVGDGLVPVTGSPTRVDLLLPSGEALFAKEWSGDMATIHRWDGTWETITTADEVGALLALEGDAYLLVFTWDTLTRICLDDASG